MNQVLLSDVCEINPNINSGISDDTECSFVPMEYVDDVSGTIAQTGVRRVGDVKKGYTFFRNDDVIFAKITPCMENGKCAIGKNLKNGIAFGSTEFHVVRAREEIIPEWIYYYLRQENVRQSATHWFRGTAGQQRVPAIFLEELKIPLPPLTEQKRIASLLGRADRLRQLRRTAHELGDALLQSVFLEMFGDLSANQKNWDIVFLEDIANVQGGIQVTSTRNSMKLKKPYLRVANVYRNQLDLSEIKMIGLTESEFERTRLQKDDLLFVEGHGNINEIGRAAIWDGSTEDCVHQNHLIRARLDLKLSNPVYVSHYMNSCTGRNYFTNNSNTTSGLNTVSTNTVKSCSLPLPPLSLQEEFASVVRRVESLRGRMAESTRQVEGLFESLLNESFGG